MAVEPRRGGRRVDDLRRTADQRDGRGIGMREQADVIVGVGDAEVIIEIFDLRAHAGVESPFEPSADRPANARAGVIGVAIRRCQQPRSQGLLNRGVGRNSSIGETAGSIGEEGRGHGVAEATPDGAEPIKASRDVSLGHRRCQAGNERRRHGYNGAKIAAALSVPALNIRLEAGDEFVGELLIVTELNAIHDAVEARAAAPRRSQRRCGTNPGARFIEQIRRRDVDAVVALQQIACVQADIGAGPGE